MHVTVKRPVTIEVTYVEMLLPTDCDDLEENPALNDLLVDDTENMFLSVEIDTGKILGCVADCDIMLKVRDSGTYRLFDSKNNMVAEIVEDYVPNGLIPGDYGDYVDLCIRNGRVENWPGCPDLCAFFGDDE